MNKSELKTGDIVEFRNGTRAILMWDRFIFKQTNILNGSECMNYEYIFNYDDDLKHKRGGVFLQVTPLDVMKVRHNPFYPIAAINNFLDPDTHLILWDWERTEDVKEVTMAEVEKIFGCKVKIVKEENNYEC